jgi:hypothetical protein
MEMPKPTEQHRKLELWTGSWVADETLHPSPWDPKGGKAKGKITGRLALDGFWAIVDYEQERDGKVTYKGHGLYGWDPSRKAYLMYWFDSMGMDPGGPALGTWEGNRLVFEMQSKMGHHRYVYELKGPDRYAFAMDHSQDGKSWSTMMDSEFRKT